MDRLPARFSNRTSSYRDSPLADGTTRGVQAIVKHSHRTTAQRMHHRLKDNTPLDTVKSGSAQRAAHPRRPLIDVPNHRESHAAADGCSRALGGESRGDRHASMSLHAGDFALYQPALRTESGLISRRYVVHTGVASTILGPAGVGTTRESLNPPGPSNSSYSARRSFASSGHHEHVEIQPLPEEGLLSSI